jgi:UDP-GlcNAc:undecaprenyl-phosphate GlcNAc-1-phosphate transferase
VSNPFGGAFQLGWLALPVTLFWFLGCMNAINLIDGMDGLAAGVVFFASGTLFAASLLFGNLPTAILCAALAGTVLGFLFFNFHPASIFLGDSGSLLLGFLLACIGLRGAQKSQMVVALLIPVVALGLPIFDTALAVVRRRLKALPISCSDRQHIHHKLLDMGLSRRRAVLILYAACLGFGGLALLMAAARSILAATAFISLGALTVLLLRVIGRFEFHLLKERLGAYADKRRMGVQCRTAAHVAATSMQNADSVELLWQHFAGAAEKMELDEATLTVFGPNGDGRSAFRWCLGNGNGHGGGNGKGAGKHGGIRGRAVIHSSHDARWTAVFPLHTNGTRLGQLHVHKHTNGQGLAREVPEVLHELTQALCVHLERVHASRVHTGASG